MSQSSPGAENMAKVEVYHIDRPTSHENFFGADAYRNAEHFAHRAGEVLIEGWVVSLPSEDGGFNGTFVPEVFIRERHRELLRKEGVSELIKLFVVVASDQAAHTEY